MKVIREFFWLLTMLGSLAASIEFGFCAPRR